MKGDTSEDLAKNGIVATTLKQYERYFNPGISKLISILGPVVEEKTEGMYIYDSDGRAYLDFYGGHGVFNFGHRNPRIVRAVAEQLERAPLSASKVTMSRPLAVLSQKLAEVTPGELSRCFFCNSGTEAVEAGLKLARAVTGKKKLIATENAFHGKTLGALSVTGRKDFRRPFEPLLPDVLFVPYGDVAALGEAMSSDVAAVILEPIQGEGGVVIPPSGYLTAARSLTHKNGALLILDEIQTGLGRTGRNFACEFEELEPDIMTLAKALGGGVMPLGVMVATPGAFEPFEREPFLHTSTFGGNPAACAAGNAALEVLIEEDFAGQAAEKGRYLTESLSALKKRFPRLISDVRGKGLLIGIELVDEGLTGGLIYELKQEGILVLQMLNNPKVVRVEPPLIVSREEMERFVRTSESILRKVSDLL